MGKVVCNSIPLVVRTSIRSLHFYTFIVCTFILLVVSFLGLARVIFVHVSTLQLLLSMLVFWGSTRGLFVHNRTLQSIWSIFLS